MTNTLCIETSGPHCSLALNCNGHMFERNQILERQHNQHLLPLLDAMFSEAQIKPTEVQLIGFGCGPGSFTGVRMAASVAQAMALAAQCNVVPLSSSLIRAATVAGERHNALSQIVCSVRSRGDAYYFSAYAGGGVLEGIRADELVVGPPVWLEGISSEQPGPLLAGDIPAWLDTQAHGFVVTDTQPSAASMVALVEAHHAAGRSTPPEHALPSYFEGDSPWRPTG